METSLVSIVTPAYKCKNTIKETFDSVLSQTYTNWEWVIVDDCSPDDSFEYICNLTKDEKRVKAIKSEINGGSAAARNKAIEIINGRYLVFLDSDDTLDSTFLQEQVDFIQSKDCAVATCGYRRKTNKTITEFFPLSTITYRVNLGGNNISCLSSIIDISKTGKHYFDTSLRKSEDFLYWQILLRDYGDAYSNNKVLATYYLHEGSKNSDKKSLVKWTRMVYRKLGISWFMSWIYIFKMAIYSRKKYKTAK